MDAHQEENVCGGEEELCMLDRGFERIVQLFLLDRFRPTRQWQPFGELFLLPSLKLGPFINLQFYLHRVAIIFRRDRVRQSRAFNVMDAGIYV